MFKHRVISLFVNKQFQTYAIQSLRYICIRENLNIYIRPLAIANEKKLTEKQYLLKVKHDHDAFGSSLKDEAPLSPEDLEETAYLEQKPTKRRSTKQYADLIKDFIKNKKIKEAIDVMEIKMIKEDRVKPENYIYNLLIGACGAVGYTKKAFKLYNDMKKRQLKVTGGTITALFNACANSPWPETDGLERATHLRNLLQEQRFDLNETNYNAMIKAFGRCGDMEVAFSLVDEMISKHTEIKAETLNFLLQACITDKAAGFRHALLVWRQFITKNIQPNIYSYNLLLRCTRDCSLGELNTTENVIQQITSSLPLQLNEGEANNSEVATLNPNLMQRNPHMGSVMSITDITKPSDRLLLLGGMNGFLQNMSENSVAPDIKTFTQLLDAVPSTESAEMELLKRMKQSKIHFDADFFNMILKRRSLRMDYEAAKNVLPMMEKKGLKPDLITFGLLSMGCRNKDEAQMLITAMHENGFRPNTEILGTMLKVACCLLNFPYILYIMEFALKHNIPPNKLFLNHLVELKKRCKIISNSDTVQKHFMQQFKLFRIRYRTWLEQVKDVVDTTDEQHPWKQFRENSDTHVKYVKQDKSKFKPVRKSRFKQKQSNVIRNK